MVDVREGNLIGRAWTVYWKRKGMHFNSSPLQSFAVDLNRREQI
jgi:hypothetical protein